MSKLIASLMGLCFLTACGGDVSPAAPVASETVPVASTAPPLVVPEPAPPPPPPPPPPPSPLNDARTALEAHRYDDVCTYLVSAGFDGAVCTWIAATAAADDDRSLTTTTFERFLRGQHVRRVSGSIVDLLNAADNSYEVRINGQTVILDAVETEYATTGRFNLWAQEQPPEDVVLASGRPSSIPVYREWPLYQAIYDLARMRGEGSGHAAELLLGHLLDSWESEYRYLDPNAPDPGVVAPSADGAAPELRALIPATWDESEVGDAVTAVAAYLAEHGLRYEELSQFPTTRLSTLRGDPEQRGSGWAASGTVAQVITDGEAPAVVIWRGSTCTYAVVPNAASISNRSSVTFAGIAVQPYRWPNLVGRPQDCIVAVGYLRPRG